MKHLTQAFILYVVLLHAALSPLHWISKKNSFELMYYLVMTSIAEGFRPIYSAKTVQYKVKL